MSDFHSVLLGLNIISKYECLESTNISAEHDVIYAGSDLQIPEEEKALLEKLGWHWDSQYDSWRKFV